MKRKFHYILQAKGGVGKSLYAYLRALSEKDHSTLFVDLDSSTHTSERQLAFLGSSQMETFSLIDKREMLVRDIFAGYVESLSETQFDVIYMDFGSPESEQFPAFLSKDIDFKEWCEELEAEVTFHIIIAGGGAYLACVEYLDKIRRALNGQFRIIAWENLNTFKQFPNLSTELRRNCIGLGIEHREFGDFDANSLLGSQILDGIRQGHGLDQYPPGARIRLRKELRDNFSHA